MCKSKMIEYACGDRATFRLSTCSGTFSYRPGVEKNAPMAVCHGDPTIVIQSEQDCGVCQRERRLYYLEKYIRKQARCNAIFNPDSDPWADADEDLEDCTALLKAGSQKIMAMFPSGLSKVFPVVDYMDAQYKAEQREQGTLASSPLRKEVRPEDVEDDEEED